jgi:nicotinamidase-related amidase
MGSPEPDDAPVPAALLVVDVLNTFRHEDGDRLLASLEERAPGLERAIADARARGLPVIYVNDNWGRWDGDAPALVRDAVEHGLGGPLVARLAPQPGDRFVVKPGYSGFDHTPLGPLLDSLGVAHVAIIGAATEMCVRDTAIDASRRGLGTAVLRDGCVTTDPSLERLALESLERLARVRVVDGLAEALAAGRDAAPVR